MTDQQCDELFQRLLEILRRHRLDDLIKKITDQITQGRIIEDDVQTFKEDFDTQPGTLFSSENSLHTNLKKVSKATFATIAPYNSQERLRLLVDILEQTLITPIAVEEYLRQGLLEKNHFQGIVFLSQTGQKTTISSTQDETFLLRKNVMEQLRAVFNKLGGLL